MPNKFIVFEGTEGTGKTTQINLLKEYLEKNNISVFTTMEPTTGVIGKFIREVLKSTIKIGLETLQTLFTADRIEHQKEINENLKDKLVISDRYYPSTLVYMKTINIDKIFYNHLAGLNLIQKEPDAWIYLKCTLEESILSVTNRNNSKEIFDNEDSIKKTIKAYDSVFANEKNVIEIERNGRNAEEIHKEIVEKLKEKNII